MRLHDLLTTLDRWDKRGFSIFPIDTLKLLFPENDRAGSRRSRRTSVPA